MRDDTHRLPRSRIISWEADLSDNVLSGTVDRCLQNDVWLVGRHVVYADEKYLGVTVGADVWKQRTFSFLYQPQT